MIIPVLPQTPFNYSYLANGATETRIVADRVPVADARTIALSVRIHSLSLSSGTSFQFDIYGVDPSRTDGTVFITSATIGSTGAITATSDNLVGLSSIISDPIYPFVRVVLQAQGPSAGAGTVYFEVSADLVVRQAATLPKYVAEIDRISDSDRAALSERVAEITIADLEDLSIRDISAMKNPVLRDLVNEAIQARLAYHVGGAYTTAPALTIGQSHTGE